MKMEITVKIMNADGTEEIRPIVVDTEIPEHDEFTGPDNFGEIFHKLEQAVLKIRNEAAELAVEEYLSDMSKKKLIERPKNMKEQRCRKTGPGIK
jgi:hypothetical protein